MSLGANEIDAIEFGVAEPEALKDEARKRAMSEAIANAKLYAEAAGVELGKVLTISEERAGSCPLCRAPAAHGDGKAAPIEAGTATVEVRVHVSFELE